MCMMAIKVQPSTVDAAEVVLVCFWVNRRRQTARAYVVVLVLALLVRIKLKDSHRSLLELRREGSHLTFASYIRNLKRQQRNSVGSYERAVMLLKIL